MADSNLARTALYDAHLKAGGKMVDFSGWEMPIHYGSQVKEHEAVRSHAGVFDVSHMTIVDLVGTDAKAFLQKVLANDVDKLKEPGKALYTGMLNEDGGVIDDLICYLTETGYRLVVNCATRAKDLDWLNKQQSGFDVTLTEQPQIAMVAVQGPEARNICANILGGSHADTIQGLKIFQGKYCDDWFIARTGYTGEDGLEIMIPQDQIGGFWQQLVDAGVQPCGLGARDTLRLEAGMNLYGSDMDEQVSPLEAAMGWTIAWQPEERDFIGRAALTEQKAAGGHPKLVGLVLETKGVMRSHQTVVLDNGETGEITSGTFSPSLKTSIAMARVPASAKDQVQVELRGKLVPARIVKLPFVRNGKKVYE